MKEEDGEREEGEEEEKEKENTRAHPYSDTFKQKKNKKNVMLAVKKNQLN